jgi:plastocyanin
MMKRWAIVFCAAAALGAAAAQAAIYEVEIHDSFFSPESLVVAVGDSVRWTHMGAMPHTVDQSDAEDSCTNLPDGFSSGMMTNGDTFVWTALDVGDAYYHCAFHCPPMVGEVVVEEASPAAAATWGMLKATYR